MSELAFDLSGDPSILPANAQYWRVRRFRSPGSRGAPEVVTTREGGPPILPVDVRFIEFKEIGDADRLLRDLARANVEMARVNADVSRNIADRFADMRRRPR